MKIAAIKIGDYIEKRTTIEILVIVSYFFKQGNDPIVGTQKVELKIKKPTKKKLIAESKKYGQSFRATNH